MSGLQVKPSVADQACLGRPSWLRLRASSRRSAARVSEARESALGAGLHWNIEINKKLRAMLAQLSEERSKGERGVCLKHEETENK